jgi:hypothetical protein
VRAICRGLPECEVAGTQHHKVTVRGRTLGRSTDEHRRRRRRSPVDSFRKL